MIFILFFFVSCEGLHISKQEECSLSVNKANEEPTQIPKSFAGMNWHESESYQGLYVNAEAKFAFCTIEKNACSAWTAILNKIQTGHLNSNGPAYGIERKSFVPEAAEAIFRDPSAIRAVFVRDPLERFLSGFLNKCYDQSCTNGYCFMRPESMSGHRIPFSMAVEWLKGKDPAHVNGHFSFQSKHCELDERLHEYNVIGLMKPSTLAADASCLLEKAHLSRFNTRGDAQGNVPFWQEHYSNDTQHIELLKSLYTREAAELVYKKFEKDYKTFSIPRPGWIDTAHGKLFNDTGNLECTNAWKTFAKIDAELEGGDEDDILTLASRAGYQF